MRLQYLRSEWGLEVLQYCGSYLELFTGIAKELSRIQNLDLLNKGLWARAFISHTITWSKNQVAPEGFCGRDRLWDHAAPPWSALQEQLLLISGVRATGSFLQTLN